LLDDHRPSAPSWFLSWPLDIPVPLNYVRHDIYCKSLHISVRMSRPSHASPSASCLVASLAGFPALLSLFETAQCKSLLLLSHACCLQSQPTLQHVHMRNPTHRAKLHFIFHMALQSNGATFNLHAAVPVFCLSFSCSSRTVTFLNLRAGPSTGSSPT
jgi:hypothetical protein